MTIKTNVQITDFLDITFSLKYEKYYPFRKPSNDPLYINVFSNYPKNIVKENLHSNGKRISEISCDEHEFEKAKGNPLNKALDRAHKQGFVKRIQIRRVIWFNPPYISHVKTNVGKIFMKLIVKHFPKHHRYHKIFNKNTIKLSYSCMQNMGNIITKHNNKLLFQSFEQPTRMCNCRDKASCQMDGTVSKSVLCISHSRQRNSKKVLSSDIWGRI